MTDKPKTYPTKTGKVLTDAEIEAMADEAECGYVVHTLKSRRRGRPMLGSAPPGVVPVRLDPDLRQAVEARAEAEHTTTSEVIRVACAAPSMLPDRAGGTAPADSEGKRGTRHKGVIGAEAGRSVRNQQIKPTRTDAVRARP